MRTTPTPSLAVALAASLAALILAIPARAQTGGRQIGLMGGFNLTDFAGDDAAVNLNGRYTQGLSRVAQGPGGEEVEISNRGFTLMLGLGLGV